MSWKKELDSDRKAIQQVEFVGQLKKLDDDGNAIDVGNNPMNVWNEKRN